MNQCVVGSETCAPARRTRSLPMEGRAILARPPLAAPSRLKAASRAGEAEAEADPNPDPAAALGPLGGAAGLAQDGPGALGAGAGHGVGAPGLAPEPGAAPPEATAAADPAALPSVLPAAADSQPPPAPAAADLDGGRSAR
jgi:hypothetical protein